MNKTKEQESSFFGSLLGSITKSNAPFTLIAIVLGFLVGAIMLLFANVDPIEAYSYLWEKIFGNTKSIVWSIVYASPLILTGLSVAFSFRTGVFNIGAEGQFVVGSLAACVVGIVVQAPPVLHAILCMLAAMTAGALWAAIVGILKVKKGINEVLSFIMFNWIAFYLSNFVINLEGIKRTAGGEATNDVASSAMITLPTVFKTMTQCTSVNAGIFIAIAAAIIIWFIIGKTTLGYRLRAVGFNHNAAEYGGINSGRVMMTAMLISGALAGLGGAVQTLGMSGRISQFASQEGFGFQGITVALIASSNPIGCIFAGLFYGAMKYGGTKLSLVNAPQEVVDIIMGTIIFFIAITHLVKYIIKRKSVKGGRS